MLIHRLLLALVSHYASTCVNFFCALPVSFLGKRKKQYKSNLFFFSIVVVVIVVSLLVSEFLLGR